jgi:hydroxymethylbilane synthase
MNGNGGSGASSPSVIRLGTRASPLALWQTRRIAAWLRDAGHTSVNETIIHTRGDADRVAPLVDIGGLGLFTAELEHALRSGAIDAAIHSLKDLPIEDRPGLRLGAICFREDARDVLITADGRALADLPANAVVGTSSPRRTAQLRQLRPDLRAAPVRGNVETRIAKVDRGEYDAVILAAAGVQRLELGHRIAETFSIDAFTPAPGQGALATQCRADDAVILAVFAALDDATARACTDAERAFLGGLGGGCSLPIGAHCTPSADGSLRLVGFVGSTTNGAGAIRVSGSGARADAGTLGSRLARDAIDAGALELLS